MSGDKKRNRASEAGRGKNEMRQPEKKMREKCLKRKRKDKSELERGRGGEGTRLTLKKKNR